MTEGKSSTSGLQGEGSSSDTSQIQHNLNQNDQQTVAGTSAYPRLPIPLMNDTAIDAYFMSLDYWFQASGVTNDFRRFNTVMAQVPPAKLLELRPIIDAVPNEGKYQYIKQRLISHFADSQRQRLNRLLMDLPLGDKKPSQLYHEMLRTAGDTMNEPVIRDLWASRLPNYAQAAVVASSGTAEQVMKIADAIVESMGLKSIHECSSSGFETTASSSSTQTPSYNHLVNEIAELNKKFEKLFSERGRSDNRQRYSQRPRSFSRQRASSSSSTTQRSSDSDCWYHSKYGDRARYCRSPCRHKKTTAQASPAASSTQQ